MKFSDRLRQLIEDCGISQKQLAQEIQMSPSTLANYVQGSREPDFDTLMRLARYFHITTDYLLGFQLDTADSYQETVLMQIFRALLPEQRETYIAQGKAFIRTNRKENVKSS
jgi:transcriptional regulator with XRE-family HTH domain